MTPFELVAESEVTADLCAPPTGARAPLGKPPRRARAGLVLAALGCAVFVACGEDTTSNDMSSVTTTPTGPGAPSASQTATSPSSSASTQVPTSPGTGPGPVSTPAQPSATGPSGPTGPVPTTPTTTASGPTGPVGPTASSEPTTGGMGGATGAGGGPAAPIGAGGQSDGAGGMMAAGGAGGGGNDEPSDGAWDPCPDAEPCRILPLGDSITEGIGSSNNSAYRGELFRMALENDQEITFVGSRMAGPGDIDGTTFPRLHEGTSGITISGLDMKLPGLLDQIGDAHILLVHIGTNDMYTQPGPAMAPQRLGTFLDNIRDYWPEALIVVAKITPYPSQNGDIMTYNDAIEPIVQERIDAGDQMMLVDQFTGFPDSELADVVHPNDAGYARMAGVWYEAIGQYLKP